MDVLKEAMRVVGFELIDIGVAFISFRLTQEKLVIV